MHLDLEDTSLLVNTVLNGIGNKGHSARIATAYTKRKEKKGMKLEFLSSDRSHLKI